MQPRLYFFLCLLVLFPGGFLCAQAPVVNAAATPARILVGDPVVLTLTARNIPDGGNLSWPLVPDSLGILQIIERGKIDTSAADGAITYIQRITLSGYDSALATIPAFQFAYTDNAGPRTLTTAAIPIMVETVPVDTSKPPRPPKDIIPVAEPQSYWFGIVLGGGLLVLLLAYLLLRKKIKEFLKRKLKSRTVPAHVVQSAAQKALSLLDALEREGLPDKGLHETYFTRLTLILREYIKDAYRIPATEMTTGQILEGASDTTVLKDHLSLLEHVLVTADPAKFARAAPTPDESREAIADTRRLINVTAGEGKRHG